MEMTIMEIAIKEMAITETANSEMATTGTAITKMALTVTAITEMVIMRNEIGLIVENNNQNKRKAMLKKIPTICRCLIYQTISFN